MGKHLSGSKSYLFRILGGCEPFTHPNVFENPPPGEPATLAEVPKTIYFCEVLAARPCKNAASFAWEEKSWSILQDNSNIGQNGTSPPKWKSICRFENYNLRAFATTFAFPLHIFSLALSCSEFESNQPHVELTAQFQSFTVLPSMKLEWN